MAIEDPNKLERVLARRAAEKAQQQRRLRAVAQAVDQEGRVTVWDFATKTYRRLWPVDAAEQIGRGLAALKGSETPEAVAPPLAAAAPPTDEPPKAEPPQVESPPPDPEPVAPKAAKGKGKARDSGGTSNPPPDGPPAS